MIVNVVQRCNIFVCCFLHGFRMFAETCLRFLIWSNLIVDSYCWIIGPSDPYTADHKTDFRAKPSHVSGSHHGEQRGRRQKRDAGLTRKALEQQPRPLWPVRTVSWEVIHPSQCGNPSSKSGRPDNWGGAILLNKNIGGRLIKIIPPRGVGRREPTRETPGRFGKASRTFSKVQTETFIQIVFPQIYLSRGQYKTTHNMS